MQYDCFLNRGVADLIAWIVLQLVYTTLPGAVVVRNDKGGREGVEVEV